MPDTNQILLYVVAAGLLLYFGKDAISWLRARNTAKDVDRLVEAMQKLQQLQGGAQNLAALSSNEPVPVADGTCGTCKHFDLEGGKASIAQNPPFAHAATAIPPWRMGHTMRLHDALVDKLDDAGQPIPRLDENGEPLKDDRGELMYEQVTDQVPLPDHEQVSPTMYRLSWADAGLCAAKSELVFKCGNRCQDVGDDYDALIECDQYEAKRKLSVVP